MTAINDVTLVTGAGGFLGQKVVSYLDNKKQRVRAATRSIRASGPEAGDQIAIGSLDAQTDWTSALQNVDTVVHLAGRAHVLNEKASNPLSQFRKVNTDGTLNLAKQAIASGVRRFIYISSIGVNGAETKSDGFRSSDIVAPHSPYAVSKWEAEQGLWEIAASASMAVVIIRPPLILGKNPKGNLGSLLKLINTGLPLPFGKITANRRDLVSDATLADLIYTCIHHPMAANKTFLVSDGKPLCTKTIVEQLAALHNKKAAMLPVPPFMLSSALRILGKKSLNSQLFGDLEVDIEETCKLLDWTPNASY
jgi:nucleoside-diphosphate-sugar epimerase